MYLTCWWFKVRLLLLLDGLCVVMGCAFVHSQCRDLFVGFATVVAVVRFAGRMYNMVFVKAGIFCKTFFTPRYCAHVWFLSWRDRKVLWLNETTDKKSLHFDFAPQKPLTQQPLESLIIGSQDYLLTHKDTGVN